MQRQVKTKKMTYPQHYQTLFTGKKHKQD